jgi:uncharacterized protein (TIGR02646 family)
LIRIVPEEPGPGWDDWKREAETETQLLIEEAKKGSTLKFKERIWKALRPFLEKLFHKKCAYCEGIYEAGAWMDVEHYRPKSKVTADGVDIDHPGYYWLAYHWRNLLLACNKCNRGSGKMNKFPIAGPRAHCPEDSLEQENPLLLNPYDNENPENHITFGVNGIVAGKTEKGRKTIEVCNLNREELQTSRQREWEKVMGGLIIALAGGGNKKVITDDMQFSAYLRFSLLGLLKDFEGRI